MNPIIVMEIMRLLVWERRDWLFIEIKQSKKILKNGRKSEIFIKNDQKIGEKYTFLSK